MERKEHLTLAELEAGLAGAAAGSPKDGGRLELIVRRPARGRREAVEAGELSPERGLGGDSWLERGSSRSPDRAADPDCQVTLMNSRVIALLAGDRARWQLAGDQLFVDLDLSEANLPAGSRLAVGGAVLEITAKPHTGCAKFNEWFGPDAVRFVNSPARKGLRLRGANARVVQAGAIRAGDTVRKVGQRGAAAH